MSYYGEIKGDKDKAKKQLEKKLKEQPTTFILFYAEWCGFCKQIKPEWNKFAKKNKLKNFQMVCIESKNIHPSFGIQGYPTLKVHKDGKLMDYKGGRMYEEMCKEFNACKDCGKQKRN